MKLIYKNKAYYLQCGECDSEWYAIPYCNCIGKTPLRKEAVNAFPEDLLKRRDFLNKLLLSGL